MRNTAIVSLLLVVVLSSCSNTTRLINPDPVSMQGKGAEACAIIIDAMRGQSWAIASEEPGEIHATRLVKGRYEMDVLIAYDNDSVRIKYEGSKKLKYKKDWFGNESIHKSYIGWVADLRWEILQQRSFH